jgi:hypothetical protein
MNTIQILKKIKRINYNQHFYKIKRNKNFLKNIMEIMQHQIIKI